MLVTFPLYLIVSVNHSFRAEAEDEVMYSGQLLPVTLYKSSTWTPEFEVQALWA